MRIAGINKNDMVNGEGVCVSVFLQGCPFRCKGCHNPETWAFDGGTEIPDEELLNTILNAIAENGIQRNLSILGGEPLDTPHKVDFINELIKRVKQLYPNIKIFIWTGFSWKSIKNVDYLQYIFNNIDYLIEGPFILEERDITLKWRGSRNQKIINMKTREEVK